MDERVESKNKYEMVEWLGLATGQDHYLSVKTLGAICNALAGLEGGGEEWCVEHGTTGILFERRIWL